MGKDECINPAVPNCQKQTLWGWHEGLTSFSGSCAEPCSLIDIYLWTLEPAGCPMVCRLSSQMKGGSHWGHATESLDLQRLPPWPVWQYAEYAVHWWSKHWWERMLQFASMENKFDSRLHNNGSKYYFSVKLFQVVTGTNRKGQFQE